MARGTIIAIVDDDRSVRIALRRLLTSAGLEVETFESAEEFLERDPRHAVGCAILDVRMPGLGGLTLQTHLTQSDPALPIIFVTAHQDQGEERHARSQGALAFLSKPVESEALLEAVTRALRRGGSELTA